VLRSFVRANRRICSAIEARLPQRRFDISSEYELSAARLMRGFGPGAVVVDAGAGPRCSVYEHKPAGLRVVAVDSSPDDLARNIEADETRVADISRALPFGSNSVDMVVSKHMLEHLPDIGRFLSEALRVLRPGGWLVTLAPCRHAPFAVLSRAVPSGVKQRLLHAFHPDTAGTWRFQAFYDRCYPSAFAGALRAAGFAPASVEVSFYQSHYFGFLVPLYLLSIVYELALMAAGQRDLAAFMLVTARKR
jgi:SAM-dependent methyltransferase